MKTPLIIILLLSASCLTEWPVSTAGEQNLNPEIIEKVNTKMAGLEESYSLLIIRNGYLVNEKYFHGADSRQPHHIRSATKTIISLLIGIAIDKGFISGTSQRLSDYFPRLKGDSVQIQHVLDMESGFKWNEHDGDLLKWQNHSNPTDYFFSRGMEHEPGTHFQYNSAAVHLLGQILHKSTGLKPEKFARKHLFEPLGIEEIRWMKLDDDYVNGGYGLEIIPSDLAKIGYLFLNEGLWNGRQIVSKSWIDHSLQMNVEFGKSFGMLENSGYGNLWWNGSYQNKEVYFALGYAGQFLAIIPDLDIVMVVTQDWSLSSTALQREDFITELISMVIGSALDA